MEKESIITALAIDDEPKALEVLTLHAAKIPFLKLEETFRDGLTALEWLQTHSIDLIFLDINMPNLSGLSIPKLIAKPTMFIFTTAYSEYAVESYNLDAIDYLLKPIQFDRFLKSAMKARDYYKLAMGQKLSISQEQVSDVMDDHFLYIKSGRKLHRIAITEITYLEKDGNYAIFHLREKKILSRLNMSQLLELLPPMRFVRVHKSYIVALAHIEELDSSELTVAGTKIPVTRPYKTVLMEKLLGK